MIHIIKNTAGKFDVVTIAKNGAHLSGTRQGFESRMAVYKNIRSQMKQFGVDPNIGVLVQDDTLAQPTVIRLWDKGLTLNLGYIPEKKYQSKSNQVSHS
ncbi:MAG: hypothetical protein V4594_16795 [Bacteroidota bacterium]